MDLTPVEVVNNSGQTVRLLADADSLAYLRKLVRREDLVSVTELKPAPARKAPAGK